ncbi:MAG: dockerin type I domain-containing protein [Saprospiraceae bacterium]
MKTILLLFVSFSLCSSGIAQSDTIPPTLVCKYAYETAPTFTCYASISVHDLIENVSDNSTAPLSLGFRVSCSGSGFPENAIQLNIKEYFTHVDVWARDSSGNTATCTLRIFVYDSGNCDPAYEYISQTENGEGLDNTRVIRDGYNCVGDTFHWETMQFSSEYHHIWGEIVPDIGYNSIVTASHKLNPLNGVTTADLLLIQKHILGIEAITSPYKLIAADANMDGKITTFDIVLLRKLILGIITELPHKQSWRFIRKDYTLPDPGNPFNPPFNDRYIITPEQNPLPHKFEFIGVKIGDINGDADPKS